MYISEIISLLFWPILIAASYYGSVWALSKTGMLGSDKSSNV